VLAAQVGEGLSLILIGLQIYQILQDIKRDAEIHALTRSVKRLKDTVDSRQF
jgi:hypothetical protein